MKDYQRVSPRFWAEAQAGGWGDDMKMLGLYLLTCEHRTSEGLFRLPVEYMAADLSGADGLGCDLAGAWSAERVTKTLADLSADGFVRYDHAARVVFLPRALAYQPPENPNQRKAAIKNLQALPQTDLLADFIASAARHCPELAREAAERLPEPLRQRLRESLALSLAPTQEEHMVTADAATVPVEDEEEPAANFLAFWDAYPRKVGKSAAKRRWARLPAKDRAAAEAAARHLAEYASGAGVELQYVPHPATFIGPKRSFEDWADGPPAGYASRAARKPEEGPIPCFACDAEVTPDDIFEADYIDGRGWRHERCRERRSA